MKEIIINPLSGKYILSRGLFEIAPSGAEPTEEPPAGIEEGILPLPILEKGGLNKWRTQS